MKNSLEKRDTKGRYEYLDIADHSAQTVPLVSLK